jgi:SNF2 family DNA or RNA helicase
MSPTAEAAPVAPVLMPHQQQTVEFLLNHPFAGIWVDIGAGKTLSTLCALQRIRPVGHILVIAPVAIARSTWIDEIETWQMPIRTRSLIVNDQDKKLTRQKRLQRYQQVSTDQPTMYFINQELVPDLVEQMPRETVNGRETIIWPFQTVIIDESQEFKSHSSRRFKALKQVRPAITRLIELTGTPAPNGLHDLWAQMYLLDQGRALGSTITAFRQRWFTAKMVPGTTIPASWIPNRFADQQIHGAISHLVMSAKNNSLNLDEPVVNDVTITLPSTLMQAYKDFKRELVIDVVNEAAHRRACQAFDDWLATSTDGEAIQMRNRLSTCDADQVDDLRDQFRNERIDSFKTDPDEPLVRTVIADNSAVLTSKLMQFASGTLYTVDPDAPATASTKAQYEVLHDEKIQMTEYLIRHNGGRPVLLAYQFRSDKEQLLKKLTRAGIRAEAFDGSRRMVARWNAGDVPVMLLHPASAGPGLNLQHGGSTLIWYTLPFSLKHYQQLNGRLHRTGQTEQVTIHRLMTKGTQDQRMPVVLRDKGRVQDQLIDAVEATNHDLALSALEAEVEDDLGELGLRARD